jgi:hypothetical protein
MIELKATKEQYNALPFGGVCPNCGMRIYGRAGGEVKTISPIKGFNCECFHLYERIDRQRKDGPRIRRFRIDFENLAPLLAGQVVIEGPTPRHSGFAGAHDPRNAVH